MSNTVSFYSPSTKKEYFAILHTCDNKLILTTTHNNEDIYQEITNDVPVFLYTGEEKIINKEIKRYTVTQIFQILKNYSENQLTNNFYVEFLENIPDENTPSKFFIWIHEKNNNQECLVIFCLSNKQYWNKNKDELSKSILEAEKPNIEEETFSYICNCF